MHSRELRERVDRAIEEGWTIERETPDRVVLVRRNYGNLGVHVLLAVLTVWWSMGAVNLLYGAYKYLNDSERKVLRDVTERACPECGEPAPIGSSFCRQCGAALPDRRRGAGDPDAATTCPECDAVVAEGARYCSNCGTKLIEAADA